MAPLPNEHRLLSSGRSRASRALPSADQVAGHFTHPIPGYNENRPDIFQNALISLTFVISFDLTIIFCMSQLFIHSLICQKSCGGIIAVHLNLRFDSLPVRLFFRSETVKKRISNVRDGSVTQPVLEAIILPYRCLDDAGVRFKSI